MQIVLIKFHKRMPASTSLQMHFSGKCPCFLIRSFISMLIIQILQFIWELLLSNNIWNILRELVYRFVHLTKIKELSVRFKQLDKKIFENFFSWFWKYEIISKLTVCACTKTPLFLCIGWMSGLSCTRLVPP